MVSRLQKVKAIFCQEKELADKEQATQDDTQPEVSTTPSDVVLTVIPEPLDTPPPLPDLPTPESPHDVLRVTGENQSPKGVKNQYGNIKVQWTPFKMLKPRKIMEICTIIIF